MSGDGAVDARDARSGIGPPTAEPRASAAATADGATARVTRTTTFMIHIVEYRYGNEKSDAAPRENGERFRQITRQKNQIQAQ